MKTYTKREVQILLKQQRIKCYESAYIESFEYNNPYSDSDGKIYRRINENSIIKANSPLKTI